MTPSQKSALVMANRAPDGRLFKTRSGWISRGGLNPVPTGTVQECIREGWLKSTPSREGGKINYAVTITPAGQDAAA